MGRAKQNPAKSEQAGGVFLRGAKEFQHDLFKSDVQVMKRNVSFQVGVLKIVELEHAHVYHSHNSQGRVQEFTNAVGGHFHQITRGKHPDGTPFVKCGPALREVHKRRRSGGQAKIKEPVQWNGEDKDGRSVVVVDNHTHEFEYEGSEFLSDKKVRAIQQRTQAAVSSALPEMKEVLEQAAAEVDNDVQVEEVE